MLLCFDVVFQVEGPDLIAVTSNLSFPCRCIILIALLCLLENAIEWCSDCCFANSLDIASSCSVGLAEDCVLFSHFNILLISSSMAAQLDSSLFPRLKLKFKKIIPRGNAERTSNQSSTRNESSNPSKMISFSFGKLENFFLPEELYDFFKSNIKS